jgi:FkbM family methyltransferase
MQHEKQLDSFVKQAKGILGDSIETVVEVGARDCRETVTFSELLPSSRVYAFECNPDTIPVCRARVAGKPNISLIECAVADRSGTTKFFKIDTTRTRTTVPDGNPGASLFRSSGQYSVEEYVQIEVEVPVTTLKTFMQERRIGLIDLLWMDIQGAELMALRGLGEYIDRVRIIHSEVGFFPIYADQPLFRDIKAYLNAHGFRLVSFTTMGRYFGDAVFVNQRLLGRSVMPESFVRPIYSIPWLFRSAIGRIKKAVS